MTLENGLFILECGFKLCRVFTTRMLLIDTRHNKNIDNRALHRDFGMVGAATKCSNQ